jgi:uncharacterized protein
MSEGFLGTGWKYRLGDGGEFGLGLDGGRIAESSDEANVRQSIWLILSTAKGERVMRPTFGCGIHNLVFGVPNAGTLGSVIREVRVAITLWEPRVDVLDVNAFVDPNESNRLIIDIRVNIRATNNRLNLVYPFYLT